MTDQCFCGDPEPATAPDDEEIELALLAKALAHPVRIRILRILLAREGCYCGQLVDELPLAQATVSQHLKILKDAGLVYGEIDGPRVCYCANGERVARLAELARGIGVPALAGVGR